MSTISELFHTDIVDLLAKFNDWFQQMADQSRLLNWVQYVIAIAVAVIIGLWGKRLIKPICALLVGGIGYIAGTQLYAFLLANVGFMEKWPDWGKYILGGVLALVLALLGWFKCLHAVIAVYGVLGYYLAVNYITDKVWLGIAGALLLALLAACVVRFAFILLASTGSAYIMVLALGKLLPKVGFLQIAGPDKLVPICVMGTVALVLLLIQSETTRSYQC